MHSYIQTHNKFTIQVISLMFPIQLFTIQVISLLFHIQLLPPVGVGAPHLVRILSYIVQSLCKTTSHKLQQKQTQQILFPYYVLNDRKKVLRNPRGGKV